jgi:hypothetical protein
MGATDENFGPSYVVDLGQDHARFEIARDYMGPVTGVTERAWRHSIKRVHFVHGLALREPF